MQGPASLLDWKLQFANAADEEAFQRSQNLVSLGMDMSWSALITLAGTAAVRAGSGFPAFQARNIYINGCSSCLPVLLRLLCPVWYLGAPPTAPLHTQTTQYFKVLACISTTRLACRRKQEVAADGHQDQAHHPVALARAGVPSA